MSNIFLLRCSNTKELSSLKMGLSCTRKKKPSCMKMLGTQEMIIGLHIVVLHHTLWMVKPDYIHTIPVCYRRHVPQNASDTSTTGSSSRNMNRFRDVAKALWQSRWLENVVHVIIWGECRASFMNFMDWTSLCTNIMGILYVIVS
jgi:hypothetical protein